MIWFAVSSRSLWRAVVLGCCIVLFQYGGAGLQQASAAAGPFAEFPGTWTGTGKLRLESKTERIRCQATYRLRGSSQSDIDLQLGCESDSYKFDLVGDFVADTGNNISGRWTERTRNVGGTAVGNVRGNRLQIHVESSAFSGTLVVVTRNRQQAVTIDTQGGGQKVEASITLQQGSR